MPLRQNNNPCNPQNKAIFMKQIFETFHNGTAIRVEGFAEELMLPAGDGVKLYTQIFRSKKDQKGPIILIRNCYCKNEPMPEVIGYDFADWITAGYIIVHQHCRGTGRSEGICVMYSQERSDGLDLLQWIRQQPFYDHEIFLSGGSYLSSVHYAWLNIAGDDIKGAFLPVQDCVRYNILYRNGFYKCGLHGKWMQSMYKRNMGIARNYTDDSFRVMPLTRFSENVFGENVPFIQEEFKHPQPNDPFWETEEGGVDFTHALENLNIPVLFITAFYDIYLEGMLKMWESLSAEARAKCAMVITPYDHSYLGCDTAVLQFENACLKELWPDYCIDWCNSVREKRAPHFAVPGQTTYYSQFEKKWITAESLTDGPQKLVWYFGEHTLSEKQENCSAISYLYDPYNPASFNGGCCNTFGGQQLQDPPNSRYDIHSFVSGPLKHPVYLRGTAEILLQATSDCEDTCFYAMMSHIHADGSCYCLRDDIIALRDQIPDYHPGEKVTISLNFAANAILLQPGERLRIDISSSHFPAFIPHRNKVENYWESETAQPAHNTIYPAGSQLILHTL